MPVCVGDTIHIVEQDTGKSTRIPINKSDRPTLSLSECAWEFRNKALWDTAQHALF